MANPFLFMEEEVSSAVPAFEDFANPFLVEDDGDEGDFPSENPFSASNPFAFNDTTEQSEPETTGASLFLVEDDEIQVDVTMSFFGTTINECDGLQQPSDPAMDTNFMESEDELKSNKPPRPNPPSQVTQQLITNLTDHLDQTSTNLLGKLPVTRTPSPVSMRDLHSPSPTPDLMEASDDVEPSFGVIPVAEVKPTRPPPPRPVPPRPSPPSKTSPVTAVVPDVTNVAAPQQDEDLFNFFGTGQQKKPPPKPPAPKSKEDILSLFTAPTQAAHQPSKPDLLSEDIDFSVQSQNQPQAPPVAVVQPFEEKSSSIEVTSPQAVPQATTDEPPKQADSPVAQETAAAVVAMEQEEAQPEIELSFNHVQKTEVGVNEPSFTVTMHESPEAEIVHTPKALTPPEQLQQLQFLQQKSSEFQHQRPTTPDPIVAQPELAPIFGGPLPTIQMKPSPPPPPARGSSVLTTAQPVTPVIFESDGFDDFSAKFESKSQAKASTNAFADSVTPETTVDAWGGSDAFGDNSAAAENCFGNDEDGFDTWDPPVVPESTPYMARRMSVGSDEGKDFSVVIRPKTADTDFSSVGPILGPPPPQKSPFSGSAYSEGCLKIVRIQSFDRKYFSDSSTRVNPFETSVVEPRVDNGEYFYLFP